MKRTIAVLLLAVALAGPGCASFKNWITSDQTIAILQDGLAVAQGLVDLVNVAAPALSNLLPEGVAAAALAAAVIAQEAIDAARAYLAQGDPTNAQEQLTVAQRALRAAPVLQVENAAKTARIKAIQ